MVTFTAEEIDTFVGSCYSNDSGIDCCFYEYCGIGIKVYHSEKTGRFTYEAQIKLAAIGIAPACWNLVCLSDGRCAYLTELAVVARNLIRKKIKGMDEYSREAFDVTRKVQKIAAAFQKKVRKLIPGVEIEDMHNGNWGFIGFRVVIIDVGHWTVPEIGSKWNYDGRREERESSSEWGDSSYSSGLGGCNCTDCRRERDGW